MDSDRSAYTLFHQAFYRYYQPLCQYANTLVRNNAASEDIVQEVFLRIWEKRQDLIGKDELGLYLFTAVKNNCLTWIGGNKKTEIVELKDDERPYLPDEPAHENISGKDFNQLLEEAVQKLPPKCREVFVMSRVSRLTYKQIADLCGISVKTVENQVSKALRILREQVKRTWLFLCALILFFQ